MEAINTSIFRSIMPGEQQQGADECPMASGKFPSSTPLAMAYVPFQSWETPYDEATAHARGTIFPSLDKPFIGEEAVQSVAFK